MQPASLNILKEVSNTDLVILGEKIALGKTIIHHELAKLHTRTPVAIPIIIQKAKAPGPVVLLMAAIHGDEVNGVEIVRQIISKKYNVPSKGTVICIPIVNVFGFLDMTREFPDGRDLNRSFPGSSKGSLAGRFAYFLMNEIVPKVDYCIDYHTGGASRFNFPQVRYNGNSKECEELAVAFGTKFLIEADLRDKSFRNYASKAGLKVIMFEGGKSLNMDRHVTREGIGGALRVLNHLGMRQDSNEFLEIRNENQVVLTKSTWLRAKFSGMFRTYARNGSLVKKGDVLGTISDPYGDFEKKVLAPNEGYIICVNHTPLVNQGDALIHLSTEHSVLEGS